MQIFYKFILFLKGIFSIFEILAGIVALIFGYEKIQSIIFQFTQVELQEDPSDFIAGKILDIFQNISANSEVLIALYLIIEGVTKLVILYGVYKDKKIVFPFAFLVFGTLLLYEIILILNGHSLYIISLAVLDALLLWVIYKEYMKVLSKEN